MQTVISILRGINAGKNQLKMVELKALYESLKCKDVVTYIQSGNVICKCPASLTGEELSRRVEKKILQQYNISAPVLTLTSADLQNIIEANPFINQQGIDMEKLHVTFFAEVPKAENLEKIKQYDYPPDKFVIVNRQAYLYCPVSYGNSKLSNSFFENKLKVTATTRNWRTVNILLRLAAESQR